MVQRVHTLKTLGKIVSFPLNATCFDITHSLEKHVAEFKLQFPSCDFELQLK